ncbi:MAG: IS110 family transposase [Actinobacteria bacterium]|nr:IS110 family transposase [Actinomycetota bacterium]
MIFVGVDWSEDHHDIDIRGDDGRQLAARRVKHGVAGVAELHELIATYVDEPSEVKVGIETDRGLIVQTLVAAGYEVFAINPRIADRYRDRHALSGAKSDALDARVLADIVRTDRHNHRPVAGDTDAAEEVKLLARGHQNLIWSRTRHVLQLRSVLLEYFPAMVDAADGHVGTRDALAVLGIAPDPAATRRLSRTKIEAALRRAGRVRNLERTAARFHEALQGPHLEATPGVLAAGRANASALIAVIGALNTQIAAMEARLADRFEVHPDAEIVCSQPGLGTILGARVLGEFGDDPNRYVDARARRNYAGTSPITRASGKTKVVAARFIRNHRLGDACTRWAFASLAASPGARRFYDEQRAAGKTHGQALRVLSNRLVGILHGCLASRTVYNEVMAWRRYEEKAAAA